MSITLSALQQQRRDTAANWTSANPTLLAGEIGVETDTGLLKIGDGSTAWTSLDYLPLSFEGYAANGIYNPAANQVALATNGTGRLFIDSSGNIGVGTSSPSALLEIKSTSPIIKVTDSDASGTPGCQISGADGDLALEADSGNDKAFSKIKFTIDGSEVAQFENNGRLGIGTASPSYKLEVDGGSAETRLRVSTTGTDANEAGIILANSGKSAFNDGIEIAHGAGKTNFNDLAGEAQITIDVTNSRVGIGTSSPLENFVVSDGGAAGIEINPSGLESGPYLQAFNRSTSTTVPLTLVSSELAIRTGGSERSRIDSSGRVGIGTSSPSDLLHLAVNASGDQSVLRLSNANATQGNTVAINFAPANDIVSAAIKAIAEDSHNAVAERDGALGFFTRLNGGTNTERLRIDSSGNVGIGTTSPAELLSLSKTVNTSEDLLSLSGTSFADGETIYQTFKRGSVHLAKIGAEAASAGQAGHLVFETALSGSASEAARIDSSGRLLVGTSTSIDVASTAAAKIQVTQGTTGLSGAFYSTANALGPGGVIALGHGRNSVTGLLSDDDVMGQIRFAGADGTDMESIGAQISAEVDGTPGSNDMPGRLVFSTTADGASGPTERMRITSNGAVMSGGGINTALGYEYQITDKEGTDNGILGLNINGNNPQITAYAGSGNDSNLIFRTTDSGSASERARILSGGGLTFNGDTAQANALDDYEEGTWTPSVVGTTTSGAGTYTTQSGRYTKIGNAVHYEFIINMTAHTGTGNIDILGLPFTISSISVTPGSAICSNLSLGTNYYFHGIAAVNGTTKLRPYRSGVNLANIATIDMDTSFVMYGAGTYRV